MFLFENNRVPISSFEKVCKNFETIISQASSRRGDRPMDIKLPKQCLKTGERNKLGLNFTKLNMKLALEKQPKNEKIGHMKGSKSQRNDVNKENGLFQHKYTLNDIDCSTNVQSPNSQ